MGPNAKQTMRLDSEGLHRANGTERESSGLMYFGFRG